LEVTVEG
jgi:hypothetical protein